MKATVEELPGAFVAIWSDELSWALKRALLEHTRV
jgi:hypothetical protein